jgi:hypothetical protein
MRGWTRFASPVTLVTCHFSYPKGLTTSSTSRTRMFNAVRSALSFLGFEELPNDERPPRDIWLNNKLLREWFKAVQRKRKERMENPEEQIDGDVSENDTEGLLGMKRR